MLKHQLTSKKDIVNSLKVLYDTRMVFYSVIAIMLLFMH